MPDLRAVVPAVLLGEAAAPADTSEQNENSLNGQGTPPPEAADSENGDSAPGERSYHTVLGRHLQLTQHGVSACVAASATCDSAQVVKCAFVIQAVRTLSW